MLNRSDICLQVKIALRSRRPNLGCLRLAGTDESVSFGGSSGRITIPWTRGRVQIGPFLQTQLDPGHVKLGLSVLFTGVGIYMLSRLG